MAAPKVVYKNSEVKSRIFEKASSSIIDSGKAAQSIVKNSRNKDVRVLNVKFLSKNECWDLDLLSLDQATVFLDFV